MFDGLSNKDSRPIALLKKAIIIFLALFLVIGAMSSHRAYVQGRNLELHFTERILRSGSMIRTTVVSSGRAPIDVQLDLIQGAHSETIAVYRVRASTYSFFDPRTRHASHTAVITPEFLAQFQTGTAQLRATAIGRHQWTRLPPPVVREITVEIQRE
jgi:hypothetical protein